MESGKETPKVFKVLSSILLATLFLLFCCVLYKPAFTTRRIEEALITHLSKCENIEELNRKNVKTFVLLLEFEYQGKPSLSIISTNGNDIAYASYDMDEPTRQFNYYYHGRIIEIIYNPKYSNYLIYNRLHSYLSNLLLSYRKLFSNNNFSHNYCTEYSELYQIDENGNCLLMKRKLNHY